MQPAAWGTLGAKARDGCSRRLIRGSGSRAFDPPFWQIFDDSAAAVTPGVLAVPVAPAQPLAHGRCIELHNVETEGEECGTDRVQIIGLLRCAITNLD